MTKIIKVKSCIECPYIGIFSYCKKYQMDLDPLRVGIDIHPDCKLDDNIQWDDECKKIYQESTLKADNLE